jgi:Holliday junction resolvase-like predicted endonuclease
MARDLFHHIVRAALEKEGWTITDDPFAFRYGETNFEIDLGAERLIAAEKDNQQIAIEIKTFSTRSASNEFHTALGQYLSYLYALAQIEPQRVLFLAVPYDAYVSFFQRPFAKEMVALHKIRLIVYNPVIEVIELWT